MLASRVFFSAPCILFFKFYECVMNTNFICSRLFLLLSLVCISSHHSNYAVTLVYNLKVRRIFAIAPVLKRMKSRVLLSAVPIFFARSSHLIDARTNLDACEKRRAGGSLFNLRYVPSKHWWLEATTGIETDHATFTGTDEFHASRVGVDDIVLAGGYRHFIGKKGQAVAYGLVGFPTRRKLQLCDRYGPLVGTRLFAIGFGLEGSYSFLSELRRSFAAIIQSRFIHGFNRDWFPVLPAGSKIQPGNFTDLLVTLQFREKRTIVETGYNFTIFSNQAVILPTQTIKTDTFIRHSLYATLSHAVLKGPFNKTIVFGAGCNGSFSKEFDTRTIAGWIYCTLVF